MSGHARSVRRAAGRALGFCLLPAALIVFTLGAAVAAAQPPANELPAGEGVEAVRARCLTCHGADLITGQRLSPVGWTREVEKMMRWGAQVSDGEKAALAAYLAERFPVR